jgi:hypothetical protein
MNTKKNPLTGFTLGSELDRKVLVHSYLSEQKYLL